MSWIQPQGWIHKCKLPRELPCFSSISVRVPRPHTRIELSDEPSSGWTSSTTMAYWAVSSNVQQSHVAIWLYFNQIPYNISVQSHFFPSPTNLHHIENYTPFFEAQQSHNELMGYQHLLNPCSVNFNLPLSMQYSQPAILLVVNSQASATPPLMPYGHPALPSIQYQPQTQHSLLQHAQSGPPQVISCQVPPPDPSPSAQGIRSTDPRIA